MIYETFSDRETFDIGKKIAEGVCSGAVVCLDGDLGVGKTVFAKGFAAGLGISEVISSPTFTIVNVYEEGRLPFFHFDVYRIADPEELFEIGFDDYIYGDGVSLIEWAELIEEELPEGCARVRISKDISRGVDYRRIEIIEAYECDVKGRNH